MNQIYKHLLPTLCLLATLSSPARAATISFVGPGSVTGSSFNVIVEAQNLFAGRSANDLIISYGFNVSVSQPSMFAFTGATSGPLFDPATIEPGTNVFGAAVGQNGFGVEPGAAEPLILATLHFSVLTPGSANIVISSNLSNLFQGLQFLNAPLQESIAGTLPVSAAASIPEPAALLLFGGGLLVIALLRRSSR